MSRKGSLGAFDSTPRARQLSQNIIPLDAADIFRRRMTAVLVLLGRFPEGSFPLNDLLLQTLDFPKICEIS